MCESQDAPWRNEELLRKKYVVEGKSSVELAEKFDCTPQTVVYWLEKFGVERRDVGGREKDSPWKSEERLRQEYVQNKRSTYDIAEEWGVDPSTIQRSLKRHNIRRRHNQPSMFTNHNGYEIIRHTIDGETYYIRIHRLLAIAKGELNFSELFGSDIDIHHKNGVPWDNRPENIETVSHSEHLRRHMKENNPMTD